MKTLATKGLLDLGEPVKQAQLPIHPLVKCNCTNLKNPDRKYSQLQVIYCKIGVKILRIVQNIIIIEIIDISKQYGCHVPINCSMVELNLFKHL